MTKVWRFLSVSIVLAVCLGLMLVPAVFVTLAGDGGPGGSAGIEALPSRAEVGFNESFTVNITIDNPANEGVNTVAAEINFTAGLITATGITIDPLWTLVAMKTYDNTTGTISISAGILGANSTASSIPVGTISMLSNNAALSGIAAINFVFISGERETRVYEDVGGMDILNWTNVVNATVGIGSPTLTVNVTPADKGDVNISGVTPSSYPNNTSWDWYEVVNLTAVESVVNWTFDHWSGDLSGSDNPTNITMDGVKNVTANFVRYYLTVANTTGGTVTEPGVGTFGYVEDESVTLEAANYTGYHFVNWTGNVSTIGNVNASSTFINMTGNYSICANFAINQYNLTISSSDGGNVTIPGEDEFGPYDHGTVVNLTATPDATYNFVNWTGDVGTIANGTAANTTITMTGNYSICANFAIGGATLEGHVSFPGRVSPPDSRWIEDFTVRFFLGGSEMAWSPINATTNSTGVFNITGLDPGTYDIGIKNWTCLSEVNSSVTLTAGETTVVNFGTTREGDSNNDDSITGADRSLLYSGWGKSEDQGGYNIHYDFNRDGSLTGADRSLMYAYWAQSGEALV